MPIQIIRPYVVGMEADDTKGKTLKASAILDAIMATIARMNRCARAVTHGTASWRTA